MAGKSSRKVKMPAFSFTNEDGEAAVETVDPTPERLRHANDNVAKVAGTVRMLDSHIDRLRNAALLSDIPTTNEALHQAAEEYLADYTKAGMSGVAASDYSRPAVDGGNFRGGRAPWFEFASLRWADARAAIPQAFRGVVDAVVLMDQSLEACGRLLLGAKNASYARAVALDRLRLGLDYLARHYGMNVGPRTW